MAENSTLGALQQQASGELTTADVVQDSAQLATTPFGAGMQGRGPASIKMAGTQPAKVNALRTAMRESQSQMLASLRERGAGALTAAEQARLAMAKSATVLGKVDDRLAYRSQQNITANLAALNLETALPKAQLDIDKLPVNYKPKETVGADGKVTSTESEALTKLRTSIGDLISGTNLDDSDIKIINDAILAVDPKGTILEFDPNKLPSAPIMAASLSTLFKNKSKDELAGDIGNAIISAKSSATIGGLTDDDAAAILGSGKTNADLIKLFQDLFPNKSDDDINKMQLADVRTAIQSWKDSEFKDITKLRQDLNNPMTSPARKQLALVELRRLGQLELTAAEAKVGNLEQQMKEGDEVKIGTEVFTVEEIFTDPAKLLQMQTWVSNPAVAPLELKPFLTANANAIQAKVDEIVGAGDTGLTGALNTVKTNAEIFKLDDSIATNTATSSLVDKYFPGWGSIGLDDKKSAVTQAEIDAMPTTNDAEKKAKAAKQADFDKTRKYELLQNNTTAVNMTTLMGNLSTIPGGTDVFNNLTYAQMKLLASNEQRVTSFITSLKTQNSVKNFRTDPATLKAEFGLLSDQLGLGTSGAQLSNLFNRDLTAYKDIFKRAGLSNLIGADGKFNFDAIQTELNGLRDANYQALIDGKADAVKNSLINKMDVLFREISKAPQQYEEFPDSPQKAEAKFTEAKGIKNPKTILAEKETLRNQLGGENHQNYLNYENYRIPPQPNTALRGLDPNAYYDALAIRNAALAERDALKKIWDDSEARFNAANNDWNNYQDNYIKEVNNYQDAYNAWAAEERAAIKARNQTFQTTYDNLEDILRGAL